MLSEEKLIELKQRFGIIGNAPQLNRAIERAYLVAPTDYTILVCGESGVGKEHFPKIVHAYSTRKHERYIAINCGAIPNGTIDSELFGHVTGAFTGAVGDHKGYFEEADGGTIFLDEVGELPLATQARLLRVLENGEYIRVGGQEVRKTNVRVVAATNVNIRTAISEGRFREDLYYRLNTIPIQMPPLRDRGEDILKLFRLFAMQVAEKYRLPRITLTKEAQQRMLEYKWPGNVRQLKNITEQMSVLSEKREIDAETISLFIPKDENTTLPALTSPVNNGPHSYENERKALYKILFELQNNVSDLRRELTGLRQQIDDAASLTAQAQAISPHFSNNAASSLSDNHKAIEAHSVEDAEAEEISGDSVLESLNLNEQ